MKPDTQGKRKAIQVKNGKELGFLFLVQLLSVEAILDLHCFLEATTKYYRSIKFCAFLSCHLDKASYAVCAN